MKLSIIVAASENNAIGKNNQMLWNLPEDMRFFKNTTWGFPVIMGRKSFEADRIAPPPRAESAPVSIPGIALAGSMSDKARAIIDAVGNAVISPDAAGVLLWAIASASKIIEADELASRITALEARDIT